MTDYWKGKRVLVTGGTGFLGSHLVKKLLQKEVVVATLASKKPVPGSPFLLLGLEKEVEVITMDLENPDPESLRKVIDEGNMTHIFHLAGQPLLEEAMKDPFGTIRLNMVGTAGVLQACKQSQRANNEEGIQGIVVCSSINAYNGSKELPYKENLPLIADHQYPYETSILGADMVARTYGKAFRLPIGIARLSNVYGPADMPIRRLVPVAIKRILSDEPFVLEDSGAVRRSFVHVSDAIEGMISIGSQIRGLLPGEVFNIGSKKPNTTREVVEQLIEISETGYNKLQLTEEARNFERKDQYHDITKAEKTLGWHPRIELREGLSETFQWYKKNLH